MDRLVEYLSRSAALRTPRGKLAESASSSSLGLGIVGLGLLAMIPPAMVASMRGFRPNDCPFNYVYSTNCSAPPTGSCTMSNGQQCCGNQPYETEGTCSEYCDCNNNCYWTCSCSGHIC